jgi:hypothetical protein
MRRAIYHDALLKFRDQMLSDGRNGYPPKRVADHLEGAERTPAATRYAIVSWRLTPADWKSRD